MTLKRKKNIIVAAILAGCLILGVLAVALIEKFVGMPTWHNGKWENIRIRITEICSANRSIIADSHGVFSDYIELFNYGDTFMLTGCGISNDSAGSVSYTFGEVEFKSGEYLIIFCDGVDVPFKLSANGGEYLSIVSWEGTRISESVVTVPTRADEVMLYADSGYYVSDEATPGYPNTKEGLEAFRNGIESDDLPLVINEIFSSNGSLVPDNDGDFDDIVEIKNISSETVNTLGWYLSDKENERTRYSFPDKDLAPGDKMVIFCSGKSGKNGGEYHAPFRISEGETVVLSCGGKCVSLAVERCPSNLSQSRVIDENGNVSYTLMSATPGFENDEGGAEDLENSVVDKNASLVISEVLLDSDLTCYGGKLRDCVEITNVTDKKVSTKGWYISDNVEEPYRFALPEKELQAGECIVLYCENSDDELATGFALSSKDSLYLMSPDHKRGEYVSCAPAGRGNSRSRYSDEEGSVYLESDITIGFPNDAEGKKAYESATRPTTVEISEAVSLNTKYVAGPYATYHDFVELHNNSDNDIDLTGWYLSDDPEEPKKCSLDGVTVKAGGFKVIICSPDGTNVRDGYSFVRFGIASAGETIVLSQGDTVIDCLPMPSLGENTAFGRPDGEDGFSVLSEPTPGSTNGYRVGVAADAPTASIPQGVYDNVDSVTVELKANGNIYYTLDATEPTASSKLYTDPIKLTKTTVIRCICVPEGKNKSKITDLTYVINENNSLEVATLVTTPSNLFDEYSGIYATGPRARADFPYEGANYYNRWERTATVSFFPDEGEGFSEPCGIRIFGGLSRALAKKSLACFFRGKYGAGSLNYKLFDDDSLSCYESFIFRNTGQDWNKCAMRDAMITSLVSDLTDIDVQNCRPVVLYINGEYYGLYYIREKISQNYVAGHYNCKPEDTVVCAASGRTSEEYQALISYVTSHDLSVKENYDYVCSLVDVDDYAEYIIAEMIIANTDNGNIKFFKTKEGKWRWIMYDVDQSFRAVADPTLSDHLNPAGTGAGNMFPTRLINALLKNPDFKDMFIRKMAWQLENMWAVDVVEKYINEFDNTIKEEMKRDCERWNHPYTNYTNGVEALRSFISQREAKFVPQVKSYFGLTDEQMREYGFKV